jgi:hypothetical protein
MLPVSALINSINILLTEVYPGPPDPHGTWFIDNEPDSGILGILAGVSAEEASTSVDGSGKPGTTIASHAEHLHWSLHGEYRHERRTLWQLEESWNLQTANRPNGDRLRSELHVS